MTTCISCGKQCNSGFDICDDCDLQIQQAEDEWRQYEHQLEVEHYRASLQDTPYE